MSDTTANALVLRDLVQRSAARDPDSLAVSGPDGELTYGALDDLAGRVAAALEELGVGRGDRVGIWLDKSTRTVAAMQGVLRLGAAYVPVDPLSPAARARKCLEDCSVRALVSDAARAGTLLDGALAQVGCLSVDTPVGGGPTWEGLARYRPGAHASPAVGPDDLAYILYTSGSTGTPKGVCISQRNALAFIEWAAAQLEVTAKDRLSNHAPFHFDLSVFDLYVAFARGASVHIVPEGHSYAPRNLVDFIVQRQISVWYSVPSALITMMEGGGLLDLPTLPLRAIVFAGEPFPIRHLRRLVERWPAPRYFNYYGPTETNVCTAYEVTGIEPDRVHPVPIGFAASNDEVWAATGDGSRADAGEEGELYCAGPTVMLGYWGKPPQVGPYATGDLVRQGEDGAYLYVGRRDHMVKVRGHRVELGEIEAALGEHPGVHEAAVVTHGEGTATRLVAYCVAQGEHPPTLLQIKAHCAARLPRYMIVDDVRYVDALPRTRNGKVDRRSLQAESTQERA